jgi:hypothetical protein
MKRHARILTSFELVRHAEEDVVDVAGDHVAAAAEALPEMPLQHVKITRRVGAERLLGA